VSAQEQAARCACCGALSIAPVEQMGSLLAVCDVLVVKALEQVGKYIVRADRARFRALGTRPWHVAHTMFPASDAMVVKAVKGAWAVVPAMLDAHGCCGITSRQVTDMLDAYVHDLVITGTAHTLNELEYRFSSRLHLPVREHAHA
jgi:hypothetical protein